MARVRTSMFRVGWDKTSPDVPPMEVSESGVVRFSVKITESLLDCYQYLHSGASITLLDQLTTLALAAAGSYGGVSVSLSLSQFAPVPLGSTVEIEAKVVKTGRTLAVTEANFYLMGPKSSALVAHGTHMKFVGLGLVGTIGWGLINRFPGPGTKVLVGLLGWLAKRVEAKEKAQEAAPQPAALDKVCKDPSEYLRQIGLADVALVGYDKWMPALQLTDSSPPDFFTLHHTFDYQHVNILGAVHGGALGSVICTAALAAVTHDEMLHDKQPDRIHQVDVHYMTPASPGQQVGVECKMISKSVANMAVVRANVRNKKGKVICRAIVTVVMTDPCPCG